MAAPTCFEIDEGRLRAHLYLHEGLDLEAAIAHWSAVTEIPSAQFIKPYRAVAESVDPSTKHPMGCSTVSYGCSRTHRAVMGLVHALLECPLVLPG